MSQFKAGDEALVVRSKLVPENIGRVVELVQYLTPGDLYVAPSNGETRYSTGEGWLCVGNVKGMGVRHSDGGVFFEEGHALFRERSLMPLRGDFTPEREKSSEVPA